MQLPHPFSIDVHVSIMSHQGPLSSTFTASSIKGLWIVDSGTSDHMMGDLQVFTTFKQCAHCPTIRIADGSLSKVIRIVFLKLLDDPLISTSLFTLN